MTSAEMAASVATAENSLALTGVDLGFDFISSYAEYADVLEAPREMHEAVAIQLIATILNRNGVTIAWGAAQYSLDLWILLLSGSGGGRSTVLGLARPILDAAQLQPIERDSHWGSPQALYQQMAENPCGLFTWGEMSEKLKLLGEPRFGGAKQWITDRFDNFRIPDSIAYRETGLKERDTPPIIFPHAPRINILATSSDAWFFGNLAQSDSAGGFVPRWMIIRVAGPNKLIAIPRKPDNSLVAPLGRRLQQIDAIRGVADLSQIERSYEIWYEDAHKRFQAQPDQNLAMSYFHRFRGIILKLALIYEVSSSLSLTVSLASWERAVLAARKLEDTIFSMLPTGMSATGYQRERIEQRVRSAGAEGMTRSALTRAFQSLEKRERDGHLDTLTEAEIIVQFRTKASKGRPKTVLVHKDFCDQHEQQFEQREKTG
jgi:hypothetical protein